MSESNDNIHILTRMYKKGDRLTAKDLNDMTAAINKALLSSGAADIEDFEDYIDEYVDQKIDNIINGAPEDLDTLKELADAVVKKANDFSIGLRNWVEGNPRGIRFASFYYGGCDSNNGISAKISMMAGHGDGANYKFLQDAIINVTYKGAVTVENFKYYGDTTPSYDGKERKYGDIFYLIDESNQRVDFYCLVGQYSWVYMTPWKRLTASEKGEVTQYQYPTTPESNPSGKKNWANNDEIALLNDINLAVSDKVTETRATEIATSKANEAAATRITEARAQELINAAVGGQSTETWTFIINGEEIPKNVVVKS